MTYSKEQNRTWEMMFKHQSDILLNSAASEFNSGINKLGLTINIPDLDDISKNLENINGWSIQKVDGFVEERRFFQLLSNRLFPCTSFIREGSDLEYTPAPDIFHDVFGHLPLITNQYFADFYQLFGSVASSADPERLKKLQRISWFSVEFGLIGNKIYGSGIVSSILETKRCMSSTIMDFDFDVVSDTAFEIDKPQEVLFSIPSFEFLLDGFKKWL